MTDDEYMKERLAARPPVLHPTRSEVREMKIEELRDLFDRGAFPIDIGWDDLMLVRTAPPGAKDG